MGRDPLKYGYKVEWEKEWKWISMSPQRDKNGKNFAHCKHCGKDYKAEYARLKTHNKTYHNSDAHDASIDSCTSKRSTPEVSSNITIPEKAEDMSNEKIDKCAMEEINNINLVESAPIEFIMESASPEIPAVSNSSITDSINRLNNSQMEGKYENQEMLYEGVELLISDLDERVEKKSSDPNLSLLQFSYRQKYRPEWQNEFVWLETIKNDCYNVRCKVCHEKLTAQKNVLRKHDTSEKHLIKSGLLDIFHDFDYQKSIAEIKFSAFIARHHLSFLLVDNMIPFLKDLFFDSDILKNMSLNRERVRRIICNVIALVHKLRLLQILKSQKISISIDEMTDITSKQALCIVVRYEDKQRERIRDSLWDLVRVFDGDENRKADAETIYDKVVQTFETDGLVLENYKILGFCSDTCSVMQGTHAGVSERFKKDVNGIQIIKCECHIGHLCAHDCIKKLDEIYQKLPKMCHDLITSAKKSAKLEALQRKLLVPILRMLKHVDIRWLSYFQCISRIYRMKTRLLIFINEEIKEKSNKKSMDLLLKLKCFFESEVHQLYLYTLVEIYRKMYKVNLQLQSEKPIVPEIDNIVRKLYRDFLKMVLNKKYVEQTDLSKINPNDPLN